MPKHPLDTDRRPTDLRRITAARNLGIDTNEINKKSLLPKRDRRGKQAPEALAEHLDSNSAKEGATMMVVDKDNRSDIFHRTNRFFLSNFSMQFKEKAQLVETFGASSVSFFDDSVKVYNLSGQAIDYPSVGSTPYSSMQNSSLIQLYNRHMRGTQLVKNNQMAVLKVMNHLIYGYPLNLRTQYNASQDKIASFSMAWVVYKHTLAMPDMFDEEDLSKLYDPDNKEGLTEDQESRTRSMITQFMQTYTRNMIINMDVPGRNDGFVKMKIADELLIHQGSSLWQVNNYILQKALGNTNAQEKLQEKIIDGVTTMIEYIENSPKSGIFSNSSGMLQMFTDNALMDAKNSVDQMFKEQEHLNNVIEFLGSLKSIEKKLYMTKLFL